jgi:hypothetical protein
MSLAGFDLEKAIRTIGTLLRDIVVVKVKFVDSGRNLHGLLILIADTRRRHLFRARAVVSHNPALFETPLDLPWYEFEKSLYASRLGEGTRQQMSQDLEQAFARCLENRRDAFFLSLDSEDRAGLGSFLEDCLSLPFPGGRVEARFETEVVDRDQFKRLPLKGEERSPAGSLVPHATPPGENLFLEIALVEDPRGVPARDIRAGDVAAVLLTDGRDIARYLAKLLGAAGDTGPRALESPVEEARLEDGRLRLQVRLSTGILGVAEPPPDFRARLARRGAQRWWRRWFKTFP